MCGTCAGALLSSLLHCDSLLPRSIAYARANTARERVDRVGKRTEQHGICHASLASASDGASAAAIA